MEVVNTVGFGSKGEFTLSPFSGGLVDSEYFGVANFVVGANFHGEGVLARTVTGSKVLEAYFILLTGAQSVTVGYNVGRTIVAAGFGHYKHIVAIVSFNACVYAGVNSELTSSVGDEPVNQLAFEAFYCGNFGDGVEFFHFEEVDTNQASRRQVSSGFDFKVINAIRFGSEYEEFLGPVGCNSVGFTNYLGAIVNVGTNCQGDGVLARTITGSKIAELNRVCLATAQSVTVRGSCGCGELFAGFGNNQSIFAVGYGSKTGIFCVGDSEAAFSQA